MPRPRHVDDGVCPFGFRSDAAMTDFNTFLTNINTELVTNLSWTSPGTNLYQSPADAGGRWIDLLFTRISATNLEIRMRDHLGRTVFTRRIQIAAGGTTVEYYTGKFYCVIQSLQATAELIQAYLMEPSPDTERALYSYGILGTAFRTTGDANDTQGSQAVSTFGLTESSQTYAFAARGAPGESTTANTGLQTVMVSGSLLIEPIIPQMNAPGNVNSTAGQIYQAWYIDNSKAFASDHDVKVDTGVTAVFRVLSIPVVTNGLRRMMMRKA